MMIFSIEFSKNLLIDSEKKFAQRPQQTYTVAMECEPETVQVFPLSFYWYIFLFWYSFTFQTNLKCIENCTTTLAILGVQTNSSVQADPDQHAPNGALGSCSTLVAISSAYFVHKMLVKPLKSQLLS